MTADTPHLDTVIGYFPNYHGKDHAIQCAARTELSALKARAEAAVGLLREARDFIDTESRVVKAMAERAQQIAGSIDAALQAAREGT